MKDAEEKAFAAVQARHYRQCLNEARLAAAVFLIAFLGCASVIAMLGYPAPGEHPPEPTLIWGIPHWFSGVCLFPGWC